MEETEGVFTLAFLEGASLMGDRHQVETLASDLMFTISMLFRISEVGIVAMLRNSH